MFFFNSCQCFLWFKSYYVTFLSSVFVISCDFLHASFWMHLTFFLLFTLPLFAFPLLYFCLVSLSPLSLPPLLLLYLFLLFPFSAPTAPPPQSAHVDMSTVTFDVDPLDLDAEEPPEFQGDPRSSKGMSGSVTSPQANAHRLPFFKKVTLWAQDTSLMLPASLLLFSPHSSEMWSGLTPPPLSVSH